MSEPRRSSKASAQHSDWYVRAMESLVRVLQELSHARDLDSVTAIVRKAARNLTRADGATFILREGTKCYYVDEDAISPLWKGERFPMTQCVSGWVILNAQSVVIEDIYKDRRIPIDVYRPTFVKSIAIVPIRAHEPIGAIGNYWAETHHATGEELAILEALAHVTSVALENIELYSKLQDKVRELEVSNQELSRFAWAAAHDLKSPLRAIGNLSTWIKEDVKAGEAAKVEGNLDLLQGRIRRMEILLEGILEHSSIETRYTQEPNECVNGQVLIEDVKALIDLPENFDLKFAGDFSSVSVPQIPMQRVLCNLIDNAIKHHDGNDAQITVSVEQNATHYLFSVADNGPGIPSEYHEQIFEMFEVLKPRDLMEGSGLGLPLVKKIISFYGGDVYLESSPGRGATFYFTWPQAHMIQA